MAWEWLSGIKDIADIVSSLGELVKNNRAIKDLLLRELKLNIRAFEITQKARRSITTNYCRCLKMIEYKKQEKQDLYFQY